jgi:proline racemase
MTAQRAGVISPCLRSSSAQYTEKAAAAARKADQKAEAESVWGQRGSSIVMRVKTLSSRAAIHPHISPLAHLQRPKMS